MTEKPKTASNLVAWQRLDLVMEVYKLSQNFPQELYG